jgi:hypothetical protein
LPAWACERTRTGGNSAFAGTVWRKLATVLIIGGFTKGVIMKNPLESIHSTVVLGFVLTVVMVLIVNAIH